MTGRKITIHIDQVTMSGTDLSNADLAAAIRTHLGALLQNHSAADLSPSPHRVAVVAGGTTDAGSGMETGVGHAVARAAMGVLTQ